MNASSEPEAAATTGPAPELSDALEEHAAEISLRILERWKPGAPPAQSARHDEVEQDILLATEAGTRAVAGYLRTGRPVTREQSEVWDATGEAPLNQTISLSEITKLYLYWREEVTRFVRRVAAAEGLPEAALDEAVQAIQIGSDLSIVRMAKRFEATRRLLEDQLAEKRARLEHQALHDPLTGLANRALFLDRVAHALELVVRRGTRPAVLFLDLDHFKSVNDAAGHSAGDQLLTEVSTRLQGVVRPSDTLARLGGDEFAILCEELNDPDRQSSAVAARVMAQLARPFIVAGRPLVATASIGVAIGDPGDDSEALISRADQAMYRAKQLGRARVELDVAGVDGVATRHRRLAVQLRPALADQAIGLTYRPTIELASDRVVAREAAPHWRHPSLGEVGPAEILQVAEREGLASELGCWLLTDACRSCAAWRDDGAGRMGVVVPVAGRQLAEPHFLEHVASALELSGLPPRALTLSFGESLVMAGRPETRAALEELRDLEVQIAVDDFGSGPVSVGWLARLPVDVVRIDPSLIGPAGRDDGESRIVEGLVHLAHGLGLRVVADGIDDDRQLALLKRVRCDYGQGPRFGGVRAG
ncbi:MAG: putative bifunctional diguanylate cyclase/phosphodiesterase [Acidimicrobiales bacterium]